MNNPVGDFILSQKDIAYMQFPDGAYWHYQDVITLIKRFSEQTNKVKEHKPERLFTLAEAKQIFLDSRARNFPWEDEELTYKNYQQYFKETFGI